MEVELTEKFSDLKAEYNYSLVDGKVNPQDVTISDGTTIDLTGQNGIEILKERHEDVYSKIMGFNTRKENAEADKREVDLMVEEMREKPMSRTQRGLLSASMSAGIGAMSMANSIAYFSHTVIMPIHDNFKKILPYLMYLPFLVVAILGVVVVVFGWIYGFILAYIAYPEMSDTRRLYLALVGAAAGPIYVIPYWIKHGNPNKKIEEYSRKVSLVRAKMTTYANDDGNDD